MLAASSMTSLAALPLTTTSRKGGHCEKSIFHLCDSDLRTADIPSAAVTCGKDVTQRLQRDAA